MKKRHEPPGTSSPDEQAAPDTEETGPETAESAPDTAQPAPQSPEAAEEAAASDPDPDSEEVVLSSEDTAQPAPQSPEAAEEAAASDPDPDSEEVVLSSEDPTLPLELALRPDPLLSEETSDGEEDSESSGRSAIGQQLRAAVDGLLALLRKPEQLAQRAYSASRLRTYLLDKSSWYRDLESDHELDQFLTDRYGGPASSRHRFEYFVRNNVFTSILVLVLSLFLVRLGITEFMGWEPAKPAATSTAKKAKPSKRAAAKPKSAKRAAGKQAKSPASTAEAASAINVPADLSHCSVSEQLRTALGQIDPAERGTALVELARFQVLYKRSGITDSLAVRDRKRESVVADAQAVLPDIYAYVQRLRQQRESSESRRAQLQQILRDSSITELNNVERVNRNIQARNELRQLESHLADAPASELLEGLQREAEALQQRFKQSGNSAPPVGRGPAVNWARNTADLKLTALQAVLREHIKRDITTPLNQASDTAAQVQRYYLQSMTEALNKLAVLLDELDSPLYALQAQLDHDQQEANDRLRDLLGDASASTWLDYYPCLQRTDKLQVSGQSTTPAQ